MSSCKKKQLESALFHNNDTFMSSTSRNAANATNNLIRKRSSFEMSIALQRTDSTEFKNNVRDGPRSSIYYWPIGFDWGAYCNSTFNDILINLIIILIKHLLLFKLPHLWNMRCDSSFSFKNIFLHVCSICNLNQLLFHKEFSNRSKIHVIVTPLLLHI